ncbi:hypothetical protein SAMN02910418_02186 [Bowdeniella nasicola]|uniref:Uncharacterized protein n=1 Tax=Bowdeniella nasicola TaxID=208480 RepID=A0A1H4D9A9_9ACTO|nr:hypothetical protein [Bowdeniella nasicola]SEA69096.1 hypothetical protein SAMN02910418_02186 [Bowdeniella nasicola]
MGLGSTAHATSNNDSVYNLSSSLTPINEVAPDTYDVATPEGLWTATVLDGGRSISVTSPSGITQNFDTTTQQFREAAEALEEYARDQIQDSSGIAPLKKNTPVCNAVFYFIELVNQFGWGLAVAVAISNPVTATLIGAVVGLGQGAFWSWARSHC